MKTHNSQLVLFYVACENIVHIKCISSGITNTGLNESSTTNLKEAELKKKEKLKDDEKKTSGPEELKYTFDNLDLNCFENCVSCSYVDNVQSARALFLFTHSWLKKSKLFYTLKDHPLEYVNVILDLSELYRYLVFYEDDIEK